MLSLGFLVLLDATQAGLEKGWGNFGVVRLKVFLSIYFRHIGIVQYMSEIKVYRGGEARHIQHMQEKRFSAADLPYLAGHVQKIWHQSCKQDLNIQISKVQADYHTLSNSDPLAVQHQTKPNHKRTKSLVWQKAFFRCLMLCQYHIM